MDVRNIAVADRLDVESERKNDAQVITTAVLFTEIWEQQVIIRIGGGNAINLSHSC